MQHFKQAGALSTPCIICGRIEISFCSSVHYSQRCHRPIFAKGSLNSSFVYVFDASRAAQSAHWDLLWKTSRGDCERSYHLSITGLKSKAFFYIFHMILCIYTSKRSRTCQDGVCPMSDHGKLKF